jgi:NAD(P)-dependent dehydrogenase (short-subunit alcohol dehydrogenase family)
VVKDYSNKTILVTGASRGFGNHLALQHALCGAHIIALARTQGGLTDLDDAIKKETGKRATLIPFDLSSPDMQFAKLGQTLFERFGKLDGLILNAATLTALSPLPHTQEKDWQKTIDVNVTANVRLLRHLDPLLRGAENPRITFVSCDKESMGDAYWGAYAASKAALNQLAISYKQETAQAGCTVNIFTPPAMATQLRRNAYPGEDQSKLAQPADVAKQFIGQ